MIEELHYQDERFARAVQMFVMRLQDVPLVCLVGDCIHLCRLSAIPVPISGIRPIRRMYAPLYGYTTPPTTSAATIPLSPSRRRDADRRQSEAGANLTTTSKVFQGAPRLKHRDSLLTISPPRAGAGSGNINGGNSSASANRRRPSVSYPRRQQSSPGCKPAQIDGEDHLVSPTSRAIAVSTYMAKITGKTGASASQRGGGTVGRAVSPSRAPSMFFRRGGERAGEAANGGDKRGDGVIAAGADEIKSVPSSGTGISSSSDTGVSLGNTGSRNKVSDRPGTRALARIDVVQSSTAISPARRAQAQQQEKVKLGAAKISDRKTTEVTVPPMSSSHSSRAASLKATCTATTVDVVAAIVNDAKAAETSAPTLVSGKRVVEPSSAPAAPADAARGFGGPREGERGGIIVDDDDHAHHVTAKKVPAPGFSRSAFRILNVTGGGGSGTGGGAKNSSQSSSSSSSMSIREFAGKVTALAADVASAFSNVGE